MEYITDNNGNRCTYLDGKFHSYESEDGSFVLPAVIYANGDQEWYQNNKLHRDNDLPAVIYANGNQCWYQNGLYHRGNDLPAVIYANGNQEWFQNGKRHRDNDLPAIICDNGDQEWWQNGKIHRDNDLPAIICDNGNQYWYQNGKIHRDTAKDGSFILPAIIKTNGHAVIDISMTNGGLMEKRSKSVMTIFH